MKITIDIPTNNSAFDDDLDKFEFESELSSIISRQVSDAWRSTCAKQLDWVDGKAIKLLKDLNGKTIGSAIFER